MAILVSWKNIPPDESKKNNSQRALLGGTREPMGVIILPAVGNGFSNSKSSEPAPNEKGPAIFATTRWSVIIRGRDSGETGREALEFLCKAYWRPLRSYLLRSGYSPADAEDLTQEFFARLLRRNGFSQVTPERGRFRNFLLVSLRNFLADEYDKSKAARRGGNVVTVSLDATGGESGAMEVPDRATLEKTFERDWAETTLERAREKLKSECAAAGRLELYEALGPEENDSDETYEQIGARLRLSVEGVKSAAFRLRRRYRELIRAEVAETVQNESDLDEELRVLIRALSN